MKQEVQVSNGRLQNTFDSEVFKIGISLFCISKAKVPEEVTFSVNGFTSTGL